MSWQPIETAPKDGRTVLVVVKDGDCLGKDRIALANLWFYSDGGLGGGAHGFNGEWEYTHWMEAPELPR